MGTNVTVQCPWCFELQELWVDRDTEGSMVQDCDVCCRPWVLVIEWPSGAATPHVHLDRGN